MKYTEKAIQIIETARDLFAEKGFKAVTTREIAQKAGVNEVTIFRHFDNKDNLFAQIIKYKSSKIELNRFINPSEPNLDHYLMGIAKLIQHIFTSNIEIFKIELFERNRIDKMALIKDMPNKVKNMMADYLVTNHSMTEQDAKCFAVTFMTSVHGLCMNIYLLKTFSPLPDFDACVALMVKKYS